MEIPDDIKIFLRSVLVMSPGLQQSRVTKDYYDTTDEKLEYLKYGYRNLYEFLVALQGEVTRLEFCPKHGENIVYAVLDKTKYASGHAKKYAGKSNTGLKSKSPEEILQWKKERAERGELPPPLAGGKRPSNSRRRPNRSRYGRKPVNVMTKVKQTAPPVVTAPPVNEWLILRTLLPQADNVFSLTIRDIGVQRAKELRIPDHEIYSFFSLYNIIQGSIKINQGITHISFPSFFTAYRAWKEKHQSIVMGRRIGVEPAGGCLDLDSLSTGKHYVMVTNLPKDVIVSTFVTKFSRFSSLVSINSRPLENRAFICYSKQESAQRACSEAINIAVKGRTVKLNVVMGDQMPSSVAAAASNNVNKSLEDKLPGKFNKMVSLLTLEETQVESDSRCTTPADSSTKGDTESLGYRVCGFSITYEQWSDMFQVTRKRKPRAPQDMPDEVEFLVTHQSDCIRFWGWVLPCALNAKKLLEIEENIMSAVKKVQPPTILPKPGHRGAALFKDNGHETWYRCYVLSSDVETDEIEVFYCDYGNSEFIQRELFRSTYNDVWGLDPLAVPFKLHGYELKDDLDGQEVKLCNLKISQVLHANVVKNSMYSEAHIVEIKDVAYSSSKGCDKPNEYTIIDQELIGSWCVPVDESRNGEEGEETDTNYTYDSTKASIGATNKKKHEIIESIYDYDEEDLVLGLLCMAHNPSLIYLKLGDMNLFHQLQMELDEVELHLPNHLEKGNIFLLVANNERRRVLTLQVLTSFETVKVLHVDYGVIEWVAIKDVYQLSRPLRESPLQARPASLAGIDCKAKLPEVVDYLQNKSRIVIKANVVRECTSGKISVELFDIQRSISINKELIDSGLAVRVVHEVTDTDEEFTPQMLPIPVKELETYVPQTGILSPPRNECTNANKMPAPASLLPPPFTDCAKDVNKCDNNANINGTRSQEGPRWAGSFKDILNDYSDFLNKDLPRDSDVSKLVDVKTWVDKSPLKDGLRNNDFEDEEMSGVKNKNRISGEDLSQRIEDTVCRIEDTVPTEEPASNNGKISYKSRIEDEKVVSIINTRSADSISNRVEDQIAGSAIDTSHVNHNHNLPTNSNENHEHNSNISYRNYFQKKETNNKSNNASYPPPDIISSNIANNLTCKDIDNDDNRTIRFGDEVISVDTNGTLDPNQVNKIRYKWQAERKTYITLQRKLNNLLGMSSDELKGYYTSIKKEKLQWKLRVKHAQKNLRELESENAAVIEATNHALSLV